MSVYVSVYIYMCVCGVCGKLYVGVLELGVLVSK